MNAKELKNKMIQYRGEAKATLKELNLLLQCKETGNYEPMFNTKLYIKHGGEYCRYLELIH